MSKFDEDDLGLPESPIFSNYSNRLWQPHTRHGSVQSPHRSDLNTDGPRQVQDELSPAGVGSGHMSLANRRDKGTKNRA
jgi:hypothetical protein